MKLSAAFSLLLLAPSAINGFSLNQAKTSAVNSLKSTPFSYSDNLGRRFASGPDMEGGEMQRQSGPPPQNAAPPSQGFGPSVQSKSPEVTVQGGSLKTWAFSSPAVERVQVVLKTEGRPLDADVELWAGPDNTPHKMRVYVENGATRPFNTVVETPRGPNTISVRNIGQLEFPMAAQIDAVSAAGPLGDMSRMDQGPMTIQGGALRTYPFDPQVDSVQVLLRTDGRPLNARIELLQGPNNNKQVIELYTEDGLDRPFYAIIETPGSGNVLRIVNTATVEFPLTCSAGAYKVGERNSFEQMQPVISGYGSENRYGSPSNNFRYGN
mmetsp:Transcript_4780/g.7456  ORF Transcript_4780/g.7456 Transcript_4780/m.7456 type:complete len:324 (-) Transcript_4780:109-1080(-)|eukprot:CAMPEP_0194199960 /NCGR_PEP_ID=MMETSP0156-20130528/772_1 /TAXON_ID=33649 /ORGANISM="Thalassionema nitzschioides, Strain L26-B" /LENGTH=323 /DNA_ID=CAMNT_0038924913 /DNA_START=44 /DNA_END=1015 /DNA_ORIENTATION=-